MSYMDIKTLTRIRPSELPNTLLYAEILNGSHGYWSATKTMHFEGEVSQLKTTHIYELGDWRGLLASDGCVYVHPTIVTKALGGSFDGDDEWELIYDYLNEGLYFDQVVELLML